jgi:5'-methylthioadenosine phosphorylase
MVLPWRGIRSAFDINFRANVDALKGIGVTQIISVSAVGCGASSTRNVVIVDQFADRTFARVKSFFGPGMVARFVARPVCAV